jgi:tRNA pseudouridine38-40 synthase
VSQRTRTQQVHTEVSRLLLAYQGTRYCGWQTQKNGLSVQSVLEDAFQRMTGQCVRAKAAGRTDSGVHAIGQVVTINHSSHHDLETLRKGLNALLPPDIAVLSIEPAAPGFRPRRDVRGKHYRYSIYNDLVRPVFQRDFRWHLRKRLDVRAMQQASECLLGTHDFAAFMASGTDTETTVRSIDRFCWTDELPEITFDVWGRAFLKHMVRILVGTCVEIGQGRKPIEHLAWVLNSRKRSNASKTAPATGLCLMNVFYDEEEYRRIVGT